MDVVEMIVTIIVGTIDISIFVGGICLLIWLSRGPRKE